MKTTAAVLVELNAPLEIRELEIPLLKRGQVLVEVAYSGACRSQLNEIKGLKGKDPYLPHTIGHEGSGIVREVGEGVTKTKPGDHVVLSWIKGKGLEGGGCQYTSGEEKVNSGPISTFLSLTVVSENRIIPVPKELPLREMALLGCALPTGAGVVFNQLQLAKGSSFVVFGVGGVGLSAILAAKFLGADPIIAVDVNHSKLEKATTLGATHVFNSREVDPIAAVRELTRGKGAEGVLECVGQKDAMEAAFQSTSNQGVCVIAGNLPKGHTIQIDPFDLITGKQIRGSWGGASNIDVDVPRYTQMVLSKELPVAQLITHEAPLSEVNHLFTALDEGKVGRALVKLQA